MSSLTPQDELLSCFETAFGHRAQAIAFAPGRVNLIGEHTDYNDGFVLPCALEFKTCIAFRARADHQINVRSLSYPDELESFQVNQPIVSGDSHWGNYVRAMAFIFLRAGHDIGGFDMMIDSDVPQGSGLSSSAALEVALGGVFNETHNFNLSPTQIALLGQAAENDFIDCQCGIMDQLISANGLKHHALKLDCRDLSTQAVAIPEDLNIVIVNSNFPRKLADSEYNQRRVDCESAAKKMGVSMLRDANLEMLEQAGTSLNETETKRARHVITENMRVNEAMQALENNDLLRLSQLMAQSHASMRDDFEITVPAIDGLVEICTQALGENGGARMTGGGFGGAVVCLCRNEDLDALRTAVLDKYEARFSLKPDIYVCNAGQGLHLQIL